MIYDQDLPKSLPEEACTTTVYIQNMVPHRVLGKITPEEFISIKKPKLSHFKIFGSIAYCHVADENTLNWIRLQRRDSSLGARDLVSTQQTEQQRQDEELVDPPTTSGHTSREVRQTLRDVEKSIGAPRTKKQECIQPDRYQSLVAKVVSRPEDRSIVGSRWIYKINYATNGIVEKYKARLVAKGYMQKEDIDYEETFALVANYTSIQSIISLAMQMG
eukprot:PITA_16356